MVESGDAARCPTSPVPENYSVIGWEDFDGNRYEGEPSDISDAWGLLINVPGDLAVGRGDEHFWAFVPYTFDDWDSWYDYIDSLIDMYGQAYA